MNTEIENLNRRNNSFNLIRMYACINVLVIHLALYMGVKVPIVNDFARELNSVPVFFLISGFLIWMSLERNDGFKQFCKKRVLRLFPELWISIIIEIILLLCLYHGATLLDYASLIVFQGLIYPPHTPPAFDNYGVGTLNGSLWTIPVTIQFYLIIWVLYRWLKDKPQKVWFGILFLSLLIGVLFEARVQTCLPAVIQVLIAIGHDFWIFFIGCFLAKYFDKYIPILVKYWYLSFVGLVFYEAVTWQIADIVHYSLTGIFLLTLFIFGFAYRFPRITLKTDISYAIYLYHMVFINAAVQLGYRGNASAAFVVVLLTLIFSYISTMLVLRLTK